VFAALTTEKDGLKLYASAAKNEANLSGVAKGDRAGDYDLVKNFNGRPTANDLLGTFGGSTEFAPSMFNGIDYSDMLNKALRGDGALPGYDGNTLVMLSSWGAAYTSTISSDNFKVAKNSYAIASFWIKTSDMNGKTAATVKVYDKDDKDDNQTLTIDTTGVTTSFETEKDIYNGWVPCFIFVENDTDNDKQFAIDFSFGNTTIKSATYEGGWVALADLQTLTVNEDVYKLASSGTYTALYSFKADEDKDDGKVMDEALGTSDIKSEISVPSSYNGLNGANSSFTSNASNPAYDASNTNKLAGLINRDYLDDYKNGAEILTSFNSAATNWNDVFGENCYQPLIIINNLRWYAEKAEANEDTYKDYYVEDENGTLEAPNGKKYKKADKWDEKETYYSLTDVVNYGFVGNSKTVSSDSYETVSVRVMVSGDAVAYIYLVDSNSPENILSYTTPAYTFYYDNEGNVLDVPFDADWKETDHRSHIIYSLRDDGLYENDGKVYANLYNLKKSFKNYKFEHEAFYNSKGEAVSFDNLVEGETYYTSADKTELASHYLVNSDGTRIYEYKDGGYYYIVDNVTSDIKVENFKDSYARYTYNEIDEKFLVKVENTNGEWVTVNFFLHTGSESKSYRLELWSGARDEDGVKDHKVEKNGAVAFDTSSYSVTSSNYSNILSEYENNIIYAYQKLLGDKLDEVESHDKNIAYYEKLAEKLLTEEQLKAVKATYDAKYYTYTLYDSEAYVPFNSTTAEDGETGYDYNSDDFDEVLAYFEYKDETQNSNNVFVDYSAVDQKISINTNTPDDGDDEEETTANGDIWLYVSSIVLVVVLLITLVAILVRDFLKKHRVKSGKKQNDKNVYRQRDRYIKKLHLVKNEEVEEPVAEETEEPVTEDTVEEPAEESVTEAPAEETVEQAEEPVTEEPAEEVAEPVTEEHVEEVAEPAPAPVEEPAEEPAPADEPAKEEIVENTETPNGNETNE
ncbi:MAG: hypothetical protein K2K80_06690, partial [Clostridia bacterium]|nr:hypothetical protein [Clostridia bacterium]